MEFLLKYTSKYTNKKVSGAQLIVEKVCEHAATKKHISLKDRFWSEPEWKSFFKLQILQANALLKTYSVNAILMALEDNRLLSLYSLRAPWLEPIIIEKQRELDKNAALCYNLETDNVDNKPKEQFKTKQNLVDKLNG